MSKAYEAYLANWKAKNLNVVKPEILPTRPNMTDAQKIQGYRVWGNTSKCFQLADGKVLEIGQTTNWMDIYALFPNFEAWSSYSQPMSFNEFWN